jgi:hypothetical protein
MYAQFSIALRGYLKTNLTLAQARALVQERLAARQENFLRLAQRAMFENPSSPYHWLLTRAGFTPERLRALVTQNGLEGALTRLRDAGVYITFDEWKGRAPLKRFDIERALTPRDFDNPFQTKHFYTESGGSTGKSVRMAHDLGRNAAFAPHTMLACAAQNVLDAPLAIWRGILPDGSGLNNILYPAYYGRIPERWFSQFKPFDARDPKFTIATYYFVLLARMYGTRVPFPEYVPPENAHIVARWAADALKQRGKALLTTTVSRALRVALAAQKEGIDLTGLTLVGGSEPTTPEKVAPILQTGARYFPQYASSEAGRIANGCVNPLDCTDVHLAADCFALIPHTHTVENFGWNVSAFQLTTLLPAAPKIMLNVEMDDYGIIEERDCGCLWSELGFRTHLRGIRSYRKLTGEGVTLVGDDLLQLLERELPARFGGSPLDYQLQEVQDPTGFTRLYLVVSPRVTLTDERAVIELFLQTLRRANAASDATRAVWAQAETIQIKRAEPSLSKHGKFSPLHVQRFMDDAATKH